MPAGLGPRSDADDAGWDEVGQDILRRFESGEALLIHVRSVMGGLEHAIRVVVDPEAS